MDLMTQQAVQKSLSISRTTLWNLRREGKLTTVKLGKAVRFRKSDVEKLIADNLQQVEQVAT